MNLRLIVNWEAEALARGYETEGCELCCGRGMLALGPSAAHPVATTEECEDCCGTGRSFGECPCGTVGPLVPFEGMMVCQRCASSCSSCGDSEERTAVVSELDDHDPLCLTCWREWVAFDEESTDAAVR